APAAGPLLVGRPLGSRSVQRPGLPLALAMPESSLMDEEALTEVAARGRKRTGRAAVPVPGGPGGRGVVVRRRGPGRRWRWPVSRTAGRCPGRGWGAAGTPWAGRGEGVVRAGGGGRTPARACPRGRGGGAGGAVAPPGAGAPVAR